MGYTEDLLVVASYSAERSNNSSSQDVRHALAYNGSTIGQTHTRNIIKSSSAAGSGSAVGIVTVSNSNPISLQHASGGGNPPILSLAGSSISAIPLTSGGTTLDHTHRSTASSFATTNSTPTAVTNTASFRVAAVHAGTSEIFVSASFDVTASAAVSGSWQLQYKKTTDATWTEMGAPSNRNVTPNSGVVTLVALADVPEAGDYQVRLVQTSDGATTLTTTNIDIAAVSLAIDETHYLQSYEATSINSGGAVLDVAVDQDMQVFAAASVTSTSTSSSTGDYLLEGSDGTTTTLISSSTRRVDTGDVGSIGLNGILDLQAANTNTFEISASTTNLQFTPETNFVAFGLTATVVPEPQTYALLMGILVGCIATSRRYSRSR